MVNSLSGNISRYYIEENVGEYGLGIFAAVASLLGIVRTVTGRWASRSVHAWRASMRAAIGRGSSRCCGSS